MVDEKARLEYGAKASQVVAHDKAHMPPLVKQVLRKKHSGRHFRAVRVGFVHSFSTVLYSTAMESEHYVIPPFLWQKDRE